MRTKTLLLTAALTAAGVAASMAQVYSVNVVGYVNINVAANKFALLANPLNNGANDIATVLPLPDSADGTLVYRFNPNNQVYRDALTFIQGLGWVDTGTGNPATDKLNPGEGFFVQAPAASALSLTFVGEVPQGTLTVPIAGVGYFNLIGSMVPQAIPLGDDKVNTTGTMLFPAVDGDIAYAFDAANQTYFDGWTYIVDLGWVQTDPTQTLGPTIGVGVGFWVQKGTTAPAVNWVRTFTVQ